MEYIWQGRMTPIFLVITAVIFGLMSILVMVFEMTLYPEWSAA